MKEPITPPADKERVAGPQPMELARDERELKDMAVTEQNAERLNREAADVLTYQVLW